MAVELKLYTKFGDGGFTKTLAGGRLRKDDPAVIANGKIDSLQTALDAARLGCKTLATEIDWVNEKLWQSGGEVSFARIGGPVKNPVVEEDVAKLEEWIDKLTEGKEFKNFIRFHSKRAVALNECRVRCREAEIALLPLLGEKKIRPVAFKFFNRLSDFLYAAACAFESKGPK